MQSISSVYISGWEYNRLLRGDPTLPSNSALPASILWSGSHQLWMFKKIYCSKESYENEVEATDRLGWIMGEVLRDLHAQSALEIVDFADLDTGLTDRFRRTHQALRLEITPEAVRDAIRLGDSARLELAKTRLLEPLLSTFGCVASGQPNSINTWIPKETSISSEAGSMLSRLARPSILAADVCQPAGFGTTKSQRSRQEAVQRRIEAPMIPELLAGEGEYAGSRGFESYFRALESERDAYEPANEVLRIAWRRQRDNLLRLRDAAREYLWTDLHDYWFPRVMASRPDETAVQDFDQWIERAVTHKRIARFLTSKSVRIALPILGTTAGAIAQRAVPDMPYMDIVENVIGPAIGATSGYLLGQSDLMGQASRSLNLAMFYQVTQK